MTEVSQPIPFLKQFGEAYKKDLKKVLLYGQEHLSHIRRRSGEDYASHGIEVASVLAEGVKDSEIVATALLHDILVHPEGEKLLKKAPLSKKSKNLVHEMYDLRRLHIDESTKDLDTVIEAYVGTPELLPLRMAHRLNDVRHHMRFPPALRRRLSNEALHMYASIAGRLGMHAWRYEMENLCFPIVYPSLASRMERKFAECESIDDACLKHAREYLKKKLSQADITCIIDERKKSLYSTYRKMVIKNRKFEDLTDRLALRIFVMELEDCYRALGVVHAAMHPIPGKLKDYIGAPKENGYRSIHTVVYPLPGVTEEPIEIQIRTEEMHELSEYGVASHGNYKDTMYALRAHPARVEMFRSLKALKEEARSPKQFEQALRMYFREDHLALFDANNNLYHMKKPATALDFIFHAYPKTRYRLKQIRVNGRVAPLDTLLHDGDILEGKFGVRTAVSKEWLHMCKHRKTKQRIKEHL